MNQAKTLFSNVQIGPLKTENRIVMAALTRARAGRTGVPNETNAAYYSQSSQAAFIITEATGISRQGHAESTSRMVAMIGTARSKLSPTSAQI